MIITRKRRDHFAVIPNEVANDERMTFEARGLLCYLLAKPNDWNVSLNDIRRAGGIGKDKAYGLVNELIANGYMQRIAKRDRSGRIISHDYLVYDVAMIESLPFPENPEVDKPLAENPEVEAKAAEIDPLPDLPLPAEPLPVNPEGLLRTESNKTIEGGFQEFWLSWPEAHRGDNKEQILKRLLKMGDDVFARIVDTAKAWRLRQIALNEKPSLDGFLRTNGWDEMHGAPEVDTDGYFRITPIRDEWQPWIHDIAKKHGGTGRTKVEAQGFLLAKSRWPKNHEGHAA